MMSLSPPGQLQWTVEGVEPSFAGCKPTVFPLDDTPRNQGSGPGGTRTHFVRVTRAVPGPSSIAGLSEQPVLVSSQLDRGSEPPSPPRAWPEEDPEPAAGLEPARAPLQEGCSTSRAALAL